MIFKFFFFVLVLFCFIVLILEIGSRVFSCESEMSFPRCPASIGIVPAIDEPSAYIKELREKRMQGEHISKEEYQKAMQEAVEDVDPEIIAGFNGLACGNKGYVRNDLTESAELFVQRHELEHILVGASEFEANQAAFKEYPWGGLQTTVLTLSERMKRPCALFGLWKSFKVYFLPF